MHIDSSPVLSRAAPSPLSEGQLLAIEIATRTTSVFSVLGSMFILSSFMCFKFFRKPINRLVFYATFGNLLANVATLTSRAGIPRGTELTGLCEFQGVLIQWFLMADSLWVFCMAANVLLVFFHGYNSQQLHGLEKYYLPLAYGIPAIPAIVYVSLDHAGHRIIGPATLWCWVETDVDWMRISFFYGPVWVIVSATMTIYMVTGRKIYKKRAYLRSFSQPSPLPERSHTRASFPAENQSPESPPAHKNIFVTTQIKHDVRPNSSSCSNSRAPSLERGQPSMESLPGIQDQSSEIVTDNTSYTIPAVLPCEEEEGLREIRSEADEQSCYRATAFATTTHRPVAFRPESSYTGRLVRIKPVDGNDAAMAYFKVAFLMFLALIVVWVPSSVNRLYQFTHKGDADFTLNFISAIVLPLQGAWNATIYAFTTRSECKRAYRLVLSKITKAGPVEQPRPSRSPMDMMTPRTSQYSDLELVLNRIYKKQEPGRCPEVSHPVSIADSITSHDP